MSIDIFSGEWIAFKDVGKLMPGNPHRMTVHRWATEGIKGIRLQSVLINGTRYTTREWINSFVAASSTEGSSVA